VTSGLLAFGFCVSGEIEADLQFIQDPGNFGGAAARCQLLYARVTDIARSEAGATSPIHAPQSGADAVINGAPHAT